MVKEKKAVKKEVAAKEETNEKIKKSVKEEKKVVKKSEKKKETKKTTEAHKTTLRSEFNKIKWPTKKEMVKNSIAVIIFVIFCAVFFWLIQFVMAWLINLL